MTTYFISVISLLLLAFLIFWLYIDFRIDAFKHEMFMLRDELFDYAAEGNMSFNIPAYIMLKGTIDGFIKSAHKLTVLQTVAIIWTATRHHEQVRASFSQRLSNTTGRLETAQREKIYSIYRRMNQQVMKQLVLASPLFLVLLFIPLTLAALTQERIKKLAAKPNRVLETVDERALAYGTH